jgi:hypothetical protein
MASHPKVEIEGVSAQRVKEKARDRRFEKIT